MTTAWTKDQHLLAQPNKAQPKNSSVLKEELEDNFPFAFNTKYTAGAFQNKKSSSAIILYPTPGVVPQSCLQGGEEEMWTEIP